MAQLVRAPPCHGGGRGFESHSGRLHLSAYAGMAELADAQDLKSCGTNLPYRFDSGCRHERSSEFLQKIRIRSFLLRSIRNELPVAGSVGRLYKVKWKWHNKKNNIPWHFTFEEGTGGADSEWQQSDRGRFDGAVTR